MTIYQLWGDGELMTNVWETFWEGDGILKHGKDPAFE